MPRLRRLVLIAVLATFFVACGAESVPTRDQPATVPSLPTTTARVTTTNPPTTTPVTTTTGAESVDEAQETQAPAESVAAITSGETPVFAAIGDAEPFRTLPAETILGTPTVVSVIDEFPGWAFALLPGRPNGETGWIRAGDLEVFTLDREVLVDLTERRLVVMSGGVEVFESSVAIGSEVSPTPTGTFFVTDAVQLNGQPGPWGPYAFGLSARSDVVTEFNGGDGIIGIHGTNQPWSIGEAASLGCIRLPNDVIEILWDVIAVGMKVTIEA